MQFLADGGWVICSLIATVFTAAMHLVNQYLRQPGHILVFWMRVLVVLSMTPFMPYVVWPTDPRFYAAVAATVALGVFADIRLFNTAAAYGGGVVSRVQPVTVWATFFLWLLVDRALVVQYIQHPINTLGIFLALSGCVYFAMRMNKCPVNRAAFLMMAPAFVGYSLTNILNKYAMDHGALDGAVFGYMYVQSVLSVPALGLYAAWRERKENSSLPRSYKPLAMASGILTLAWLGHMTFKNTAIAFTPNPSYQSAINLTAPLFIALFYFMTGYKEKADVKSGMGVVVCATILALLTLH